MVLWLVSLPLINRRKEMTWEVLEERTSSGSLGQNFKFNIPELRVGTLDTLMALSDDLSKTNNVMEAVVNKIRRTVGEVGGDSAQASLKVDGLPPQAYLTRFKWDEAKFPIRRPLRECVDKMTEIVGHIEDDLKIKTSEYNNLKSQLSAVSRKQTGSLAVRDVSTVVKPQHLVDSENLATLFVVVSKFNIKEWEAQYEKMCNFIVPRSSKMVAEDNDYALVSVVLFKRVVDDFKAAARSKGYQVREYVPISESGDLTPEQVEQLKRDVDSKKVQLEQWCKTAYGEVFSAWMHVLAIRVHVESILRYGLPPAYVSAVIQPSDKQEQKLRNVLAQAFSTDGKSHYWKDDGTNNMAGLAGDTELHPYVSFTLNIDG